MAKISIVIPIFNEAVHIEATLKSLLSIIDKLADRFNLVLVDDGSTDETWQIIQKMSQLDSRVRCLRLSRNFGKENAICAGISHCSDDAVVVMDIDGQHPFEMIAALVEAWKGKKVWVVEALKSARSSEPYVRGWAATLYYKIFKVLSGVDLSKSSDFMLLDRKFIDAWVELDERNVFFRGLANWLGFERTQIYFEPPARLVGNSKYTLTKLLRLSIGSILSFSSVPLYLISLVGILFLFFAAVMVFIALYQWTVGIALEGFTTVIILQLLIGGLVLSALGILGLYQAKIYDEIKGRPRFVIAEVSGGVELSFTRELKAL